MSFDPSMQSITGANLSYAWANAFIKSYETNGNILSPAVVRFPAYGSDGGVENAEIRRLIESQLADPERFIQGQSVIETVAGTIFPESVWLLSGGDRHLFFSKYRDMLPFIQRRQSNRRGVYFQRMVAYSPALDGEEPINQLEHVIATWERGTRRHSAFQAGIFDPRIDHSPARLWGFPCLQQIVFHANGAHGKDGLSINAFYATQTLEEKGYGNYLGLHRLGLFMAKEMGLQFKEVVCIASALKLNNTGSRTRCGALVKSLKELLPAS